MKTLHALAIAETATLFVSRYLHAPDSVLYTIIGMMIATFGYILENVLREKTGEGSKPRRRAIVIALFAAVIVFYWLLGLI